MGGWRMRLLLAATLVLAGAMPGRAQFYNGMPTLCLGHLMTADVVGDYTFSTGALALSVNGNVITPDPAGQGSVTLAADPDPLTEFVLSGLPAPMPDVQLNQTTATSGPGWTLSRAPGIAAPNADMELTWACKLKDLPALEGRFRSRSQDGFDIDNSFRLVVMDANWMIGLWEFDAVGTPYPVHGIRSIELSRSAP